MRTFVVWVAVLAACHDPAPKTAVQPPAAAPVPAGPDLGDPYALLPADSDLIARIDFATLRHSPLWTKYRSMVLEVIAPSFASCSDDPLADLTSFTAGMPMSEHALGMFVVRGLDRDKLLRCLHAPTPETATTVSFDGDFVTLANKSGNTNMLTFVDAHTAVIQGSKGPTKQTLAQALTIGAPLRQDAALAALDKRLAPHAGLSLILRPRSREAQEALEQKIGTRARFMYATLHLTDRVELHAAVGLERADDATAIVSGMQPKIAAIRPYVDQFDERAEGDTVYVDVAVTEAQLKLIVENVKRMMGPS